MQAHCAYIKASVLLTHLPADKEFLAQKSAPHRDFYNVRKVDTHVHHRLAQAKHSGVVVPGGVPPMACVGREAH